jgi:hypothetical protein
LTPEGTGIGVSKLLVIAQTRSGRLGLIASSLALLYLGAFPLVFAASQGANNSSLTSVPAKSWAEQAAAKEIEIILHSGSYIRYHQRTIDSRRDELRDVIESKDGTVARLLMRDNRAADRRRRPGRARPAKRPHRPSIGLSKDTSGTTRAARSRLIDLIKIMPDAMIFTYAADQTPAPEQQRVPGRHRLHANPKFNPPTTESQALSGLRGRAWIDARRRPSCA